MHCIDDRPNGIVINFNSDWSGDARIAWYVASERRDPGPVPPSLRECQCVGRDLVAGRFTLTDGAEPPINVLTRAVALAVEIYLCRKMTVALDDICANRSGQLHHASLSSVIWDDHQVPNVNRRGAP
jgi:hypothetical protein